MYVNLNSARLTSVFKQRKEKTVFLCAGRLQESIHLQLLAKTPVDASMGYYQLQHKWC